MITTDTSAQSARFIAMPILLFAIFAVALIGIFTLARSQQVASQLASSNQTSVEAARRNHRLLELNEGIKPVVTAVPFDRNKRLLELNEGYAPTPVRSPRDQRLYEINR